MIERQYWIPGRDVFVVTLIVLGFGLLVGRAAFLQIGSTDSLQEAGKARYLRSETVSANRGLIRDRNNEILAISTPVDSLWADPQVLVRAPKRWAQLAALIDVPEKTLKSDLEKYSRENRQFMYLRRHMAPESAEKVTELQIPGVSSMREYRRYYPHGSTAATIIGYTNIDDIGLEGIELSMNSTLEGKPGLKRVIKDRLGRTVETVEIVRPVQDGNDVRLSIDSRIQQIVYKSLLKVVTQERAALATSVVIDVSTGEILAIASAPGFNPNKVRDRRNTRNFAVTDVFEPGSTIKPFSVAKSLIDGVVTPTTLIDTSPGWLRIGGYTIKDIRNFGELSVEDVIMKSSNVGVTKFATQVEPNEMASFYKSIGFSKQTGSGISGESSGLFPMRTKWRESEHATLTYGYGFAVTALQLVQAYGALANDGVLIPLTISATDNSDQGRRVMSSEMARELTRMTQRVVSPTGTSWRAKVPLYKISGKSGTVQKLIDGRYSEDRFLALFVGFAPSSHPRLAAVVIVDEPSADAYYGGVIAAPVFKEIMTAALRILNESPDDLEQFADSEKIGEGTNRS